MTAINSNNAISAPCMFGGCTAIAHTSIDWSDHVRTYICDEHGPVAGEMAVAMAEACGLEDA